MNRKHLRTARNELPAANSFADAEKTGYLHKLSGRGFLYPGTWKKRYCVLNGNRFYYYEKEKSKGTEKSSGVINLEYYDLCVEATGKDSKKASNVFIISTSDKTFFDSGKYLFSAETLTEMNEWVHKIQRVIAKARGKGKKRRSPSKGSLSTPTSPCISALTSKHDDLSRFVSLEMPTTERLFSATKHRVPGPRGRRLPQRKSLMPRTRVNFVDEAISRNDVSNRLRANSLSALEMESSIEASDVDGWLSRSIELDDSQASGENSMDQQDTSLLCQFSSSEESLVHEELRKCPEASMENGHAGENVMHLRSGGLLPRSSTKREQLKAAEAAAKEQVQRKSNQLSVCRPDSPVYQSSKPVCLEIHEPSEPCANLNPPDLSRLNLRDSCDLQSLLQNQSTNLMDVVNVISTLKNTVGSVQQNANLLQNNLASVQSGMDGTSERLEKLTAQMQQLEQQMIVTLKDVQCMHEQAYQLFEEAEKAKAGHMLLKQLCQETLQKLLQATPMLTSVESIDNQNQSDT